MKTYSLASTRLAWLAAGFALAVFPVTGGNPYGFAGSGLNVTLSDAATGGIDSTPETPGAVLNGTYQAAGALSGFNGSAADGTWTLFFSDLGQGGSPPALTGWSLDITAVPEPVNLALWLLAPVLLASAGPRSKVAQKAEFDNHNPT